MRAVVQDRYGSGDVLRSAERPEPVPGPGEVLVEVLAAGIDRGTEHLVTGLPHAVRLATGLRRPRRTVPGRDLSGRVVAVGPGTPFTVGQTVFGIGREAFAERAIAPATTLAVVPDGVDPLPMAVVGVSGTTALQAVRRHGKVRPGQRVLVLGASGGVGSFAVQLAVDAGAQVTAVTGPTKREFALGLGVHRAVEHTRPDLFDVLGPHDVVVDTGGAAPLRSVRRAMTPTGRHVIVGAEGGGALLGGLDRQARAAAGALVSRHWAGTFVCRENADDLTELADLVARGRLRPALDRTFALEEAGEALRYLAAGRVRGKIAVRVA
ncbi:NAD(P)-dependent alcohol dehydrogenase [Kineococcus sp. SYSU DK001]|uniref:NAD(P)-dependent alcohol dehydrogenase n=1 Tax=Kineococcus sp. SYSU DK001 TaxID=3383122 RepID=UPI003D7C9AB5